MHSNNASTITIDATAFEAAGLTLSVTTVPLDEARDHWVGGTYSMWGFWGSSPPCPFLAAVPLDFSGAEGCCGYWCDPSECVGTFGRRVDVAAEHLADSASWSKNGAPWKDCPWVAGYAEGRCAVVGADGTLASESCPAACGGVLAVSLEASCYDERAEEIRATIGVATAAPTAAGDGPETAALSCELYDAYGNCVDDGCQRWCPFRRPSISRVVPFLTAARRYDGCNHCRRLGGGLACTKMYCATPDRARCMDETAAPAAAPTAAPAAAATAVAGEFLLLGVELADVAAHADVVAAAVAAVADVAVEDVAVELSARAERRRRLDDGGGSVVVSYEIRAATDLSAARVASIFASTTADDFDDALAAAAAAAGASVAFADAEAAGFGGGPSLTTTAAAPTAAPTEAWWSWNETSAAVAVVAAGSRRPLLAGLAAGLLLGARADEADACGACALSDGVVHVVLAHDAAVNATYDGAAIRCVDAATGAAAPCTSSGAACRTPSSWSSGCVYGRPQASGAVAETAWAGAAPAGGDGGWLDARVWAARAAAEHASTASFASFALLLAAAGAPLGLLAEAARGMADEVRHAEDAYAVAGRLAGAAAAPMALAVDDAAERRRAAPSPRAAVVVDAFDAGCVAETAAAARAERDAADAARDLDGRHGFVVDALRRVADDERRHAAFAWRALRWAAAGDAAANATLAARVAAFAGVSEVDRELVRPAAASVLAGRPPAFGGLRPGLRALGDEIAAALARD